MYPYMRGFIPRTFTSMPTSNLVNPGLTQAATRTIPFSAPKAAAATTAAKATKSLSFSSILSGAQKGINTLNQIIPLYNQVKPLIQNGKQMLNIFKKVKNTEFEPEGIETPNTETSVEESPKEQVVKTETTINKNSEPIIFNQTQPSKPFFV